MIAHSVALLSALRESNTMMNNVLFERACFYRGLLVIPLAIPGNSYGFAIMEPGCFDAIDHDWQEYDSIGGCLQAGRSRIDRYLEKLPRCLTEVLDRDANHPLKNVEALAFTRTAWMQQYAMS